MGKTIAIPVIILLFLCLSPVSGVVAGEKGCITVKCHPGLLNAKNVHPAAEPCDTCHLPLLTPHPQKKKKTFKLAEQVPGLCGQCHALFGKLKHVHPPVKEGMCTTCHDPHASTEPKLLVRPVQEVCGSCHPDKSDFKYVHGPVAAGDCTVCHNPHESDTEHLLVQSGSALCFTCHVDLQNDIKKNVVHPALEGGCTSCHNPHGSLFKKFFSAAGAALCYQCHPQIESRLQSARSVHPPIKSERGCASCHAPHASDAPKLLAKEGKDLCLDCHKDLIKKNQTVLHGPIRAGKCTPCHDPHGTPNSKLLIKPFPTEFYVTYSGAEFQLCFSCHNRDMLRNATTSYATGFRDGERNLHYLHVNRKDRGKSCKACHVVHAGENPKLIADKVPFNKWNLPIRFVKSETGGSCAPGCHQKYSYDRKTPGKEAVPEKTGEKGKTKTK